MHQLEIYKKLRTTPYLGLIYKGTLTQVLATYEMTHQQCKGVYW